MIRAEQVPKEAAAWLNAYGLNEYTAQVAIAAALNAWPGMAYDPGALVTDTYRDPGKIILPLPKEASDE